MAYRADRLRRPRFGWKLFLALLVVAAVILAVLEATNTTHLFHSDKTPKVAKTTSSRDTAQSSFSNGTPKSSSSARDIEQGGAVNNDSPVVAPASGRQVSSSSGVITLYTPTNGEQVKNGSTLSGKSSAETVYFRLIDNSTGKIAESPISVVNGTFSATMQFTPHGKTGVLKLYSIDSSTGKEVNQVKIDVIF